MVLLLAVGWNFRIFLKKYRNKIILKRKVVAYTAGAVPKSGVYDRKRLSFYSFAPLFFFPRFFLLSLLLLLSYRSKDIDPRSHNRAYTYQDTQLAYNGIAREKRRVFISTCFVWHIYLVPLSPSAVLLLLPANASNAK